MSKKLTLNQMKAIAMPDHSPTIITRYTDNGEEINLEFDTNLSITETSRFVDTVADNVFTYLDEYIPEYKDVWTFIALIQISNMPLPKKKVKDGDDIIDIKTAYDWMHKLNIIDRLRNQDENLGGLLILFNKINPMIADKIEFKKQEILSAQKADLLKTQFELERLTDLFSNIGEQFSEVDINELAETAKEIANKDEKELVNNIISIQSAKDAVENKE